MPNTSIFRDLKRKREFEDFIKIYNHFVEFKKVHLFYQFILLFPSDCLDNMRVFGKFFVSILRPQNLDHTMKTVIELTKYLINI